jgi:ferredoxin
MTKHTVFVEPDGGSYECRPGEGIFQMLSRCSRQKLPRGCTSGGCGVCKVHVVEGAIAKIGVMSRAHVTESDELQGVYLACRVTPVSAVRIELTGKLKSVLLTRTVDCPVCP